LVAHHDSGYRILVIYLDPRHREVFEQTGKFAISTKRQTPSS